MGKLIGLQGISASEIECDFFAELSNVKKILDSGKGATTAGNNGAINIWKDDDGLFRCEAMRYCRILDSKIYSEFTHVEQWVRVWLEEIN